MYQVLLCDVHDVERNLSGFGETGAAGGSADDLVVTAAGAKETAELVMLATEAGGGIMAVNAAHASDATLDAAMILFKVIVEIHAGPVPHGLSQYAAGRPGVGTMAVRRHRSDRKPMVALAARTNAFAAVMSRCSLSIASIRLPSQSTAVSAFAPTYSPLASF
jgi:hypothetical protein